LNETQIWGAAHVFGWERGRAISQIDWHRQNVRPLIQDALGVDRDEYPKLPYDIDALGEKIGSNKRKYFIIIITTSFTKKYGIPIHAWLQH